MPKEIANKTKEVYPVGSRSDSFGETYPIREPVASNGASYKCLPVQILDYKFGLGTHCLPAVALAKEGGDEIFWNTYKSMTYCKCGALGVDGCEFYACPVVSFAVYRGAAHWQ